jgi:hypothetical protein
MKKMIKKSVGFAAIVAALVIGGVASSASANSVTFAGSNFFAGDSVTLSAKAVFTISANTVQIVLTNTTPVTKSAMELLTGLQFTLTSGKTVTTETQALASDVIDLQGPVGTPTVTDLPQDDNLLQFNPAEWGLGSANTLTWNNGSGPDFGILGPAPYTSANSSIVGNGPHNPYVNQTITFTLTGAGISASDTVKNATFYYGTGFAAEFAVSTGTVNPVPLPSAAASGFGLLAILGVGAKLRKKLV